MTYVLIGSKWRKVESNFADGRGLDRHPLSRAALPRGSFAEGEAHVPAFGEATAPEPLRCVGRRGRPSRRLAAESAHARSRRARVRRCGAPARGCGALPLLTRVGGGTGGARDRDARLTSCCRDTSSLRSARVYVSVLGGERKRERSLAGLSAAHGVLQARVSQELRLKRTPLLAFEYDPSVERGVRMSQLIDELAPAPDAYAADDAAADDDAS